LRKAEVAPHKSMLAGARPAAPPASVTALTYAASLVTGAFPRLSGYPQLAPCGFVGMGGTGMRAGSGTKGKPPGGLWLAIRSGSQRPLGLPGQRFKEGRVGVRPRRSRGGDNYPLRHNREPFADNLQWVKRPLGRQVDEVIARLERDGANLAVIGVGLSLPRVAIRVQPSRRQLCGPLRGHQPQEPSRGVAAVRR